MDSKEYKMTKKLGEELGMNVFHSKKFDIMKHKIKIHTRICYRCGKKHKIIREDNILSNSKRLCNNCRRKSHLDTMRKIKIKNKNKWELLFLNILKENKKAMSIQEISKEIRCSIFPIWKISKILLKQKKVKSFIIHGTILFYL